MVIVRVSVAALFSVFQNLVLCRERIVRPCLVMSSVPADLHEAIMAFVGYRVRSHV